MLKEKRKVVPVLN